MKKYIILTFLLSSLISYAGTNNNQFDVTADITAGCKVSMDNINLGVLEGIITAALKDTNLKVSCSKGVPYTIKTQVAQGIESPDQDGHFFKYIYPLYHATDPVAREFIGYRIKNIPAKYRFNTYSYFGDGSMNDQGSQTNYIVGIGQGLEEIITLKVEYYTYIPLKSGNYTATQTFTLEY